MLFLEHCQTICIQISSMSLVELAVLHQGLDLIVFNFNLNPLMVSIAISSISLIGHFLYYNLFILKFINNKSK